MLIRIKPTNQRATHVIAGYVIEKAKGWAEIPDDVAAVAKSERMSDSDSNSPFVFDVRTAEEAAIQVETESFREDPAGTPDKPLRLRQIPGTPGGRGDLAAHDLIAGNNPSGAAVAHLDRPNMAEADATVRAETAKASAAEGAKAALQEQQTQEDNLKARFAKAKASKAKAEDDDAPAAKVLDKKPQPR